MTVRLSAPRRARGAPAYDRRLLLARARRMLAALDHSRSELSLALVSDDEIARLNEADRGRAAPTDVLSYSLVEGESSAWRGRLLGDVVIALGVAERQARAGRRAFDDELARLVVHGLLHLLGHDHERDDEARLMRGEERRVWRAACAEPKPASRRPVQDHERGVPPGRRAVNRAPDSARTQRSPR